MSFTQRLPFQPGEFSGRDVDVLPSGYYANENGVNEYKEDFLREEARERIRARSH